MTLDAIGRYQVFGEVGAGGFATVYRAHDPVLDRALAIKVLHPHLARDPQLRARFVREGRALARIHHPNVVLVHDAGETAESAYLAMEFVAGRTLSAVAARRRMPLAEVLPIVRQVASALDALHAAGLIHRDVKPANVLVANDGRAVLLDLGIAHASNRTEVSSTGSILGTPGYLAPEQVEGSAPVSPATDVYQLGATVYALLAGRPPFEGDTVQVLYAVVHRAPPDLAALRPDLPPYVIAAVARALAKEPTARPARATDFAAALEGRWAEPHPGTPMRPAPGMAPPASQLGAPPANEGSRVMHGAAPGGQAGRDTRGLPAAGNGGRQTRQGSGGYAGATGTGWARPGAAPGAERTGATTRPTGGAPPFSPGAGSRSAGAAQPAGRAGGLVRHWRDWWLPAAAAGVAAVVVAAAAFLLSGGGEDAPQGSSSAVAARVGQEQSSPSATTTPSATRPVSPSPPPGSPAPTAAAGGQVGTDTPVPTPNPTPTAAACGWAGVWTTTFGALEMKQIANSVTGTYTYREGKLSGTVEGNVLRGTWNETPPQGAAPAAPHEYDGNFEFTLASGCRSFTGRWRHGTTGDWQPWSGSR